MQVFKVFFKVLNHYKGRMIMYLGIFLGVLLAMFSITGKNDNSSYVSSKSDFAVFDYDDTDESRALVAYMAKTDNLKKIKADDKETVQDELFARNIDCVVRIRKGFGEALAEGSIGFQDGDEAHALLEVAAIPDVKASMGLKSHADSFIHMVDQYVKAGLNTDSAIKKAQEALDLEVEVSLPDGSKNKSFSKMYNYFNYLGWTLIAMMIVGISPVLQVFGKKGLRERIQCSSYQSFKMNRELLLGTIVTGGVICFIIIIGASILIGKDLYTLKGVLYILNMLCYMLVALSLAFMISKLTSKDEILSMLSNVVSLGMAFLCGIFVPAEFLGDGVIMIAHFLPAYWYNVAATNIDFYGGNMRKILLCMCVELLFAAAIALVGLVVDWKRRAAH